MGAHAVECLANDKTNRVIGIHGDKVFDEDIVEALAKKKIFNEDIYHLANDLVRY